MKRVQKTNVQFDRDTMVDFVTGKYTQEKNENKKYFTLDGRRLEMMLQK